MLWWNQTRPDQERLSKVLKRQIEGNCFRSGNTTQHSTALTAVNEGGASRESPRTNRRQAASLPGSRATGHLSCPTCLLWTLTCFYSPCEVGPEVCKSVQGCRTGVPRRIVQACVDQLPVVLMKKVATIILTPKRTVTANLNDHRSMALKRVRDAGAPQTTWPWIREEKLINNNNNNTHNNSGLQKEMWGKATSELHKHRWEMWEFLGHLRGSPLSAQ